MFKLLKRSFLRKRIPLTVPGPSPWYLRTAWASIKTARGLYTWEILEGPKLAGVSCLTTPANEAVVLLDVYCYVLPLSNDRVLVWHESGRDET